jgi:non-ribosomal peptide synthase protein (TIGR01720 family)
VPSAYRTQINDVLLTALVQAFSRWTGRQTLLVDLEGHGREPIFDGVDLSRTIGWFTTISPVLLDISDLDGPGEALKSVKEQLRKIPKRGLGYGALRYLSADAVLEEELRRPPGAQVVFNYLGQFHEARIDADGLEVEAASGLSRSTRGLRRHLLEVGASVVDGRLQIVWQYSENAHRRATVERLSASFLDALQTLIRHCQHAETSGYTPSDFSRARAKQRDLDSLLSRLNDKERRLGRD